MDIRSPVRLGRPRAVDDDAIFAAMTRVLHRVGWPRLTLALVAREVHVTPGALRQRFGSKHDLLVAFNAWILSALQAQEVASAAEAGSPLERLRRLFAEWIGPFAARQELANALTAIVEAAGDPVLRRQVEARLDLVHGRIETLVAEAVAAGDLRRVEPASLARVLFAAVEGAMVIWSIRGDGSAVDRAEEVIDQVLGPYRWPADSAPATTLPAASVTRSATQRSRGRSR